MRESGRRQERRGSDVETPPSPKSLGPCPTLLMCLDPSSSAKPNTRFLSISALKCISPRMKEKRAKRLFSKQWEHTQSKSVSQSPLCTDPRKGAYTYTRQRRGTLVPQMGRDGLRTPGHCGRDVTAAAGFSGRSFADLPAPPF